MISELEIFIKPELVGPVVFIWALGAMEPERRFLKRCFLIPENGQIWNVDALTPLIFHEQYGSKKNDTIHNLML